LFYEVVVEQFASEDSEEAKEEEEEYPMWSPANEPRSRKQLLHPEI